MHRELHGRRLSHPLRGKRLPPARECRTGGEGVQVLGHDSDHDVAVVAVGRRVRRGGAEKKRCCQPWRRVGRRHTHSQTAAEI